MSEKPVPSVNGISPKDGTPGTLLTIRGENLGSSVSDIVHIYVGEHDVGVSVKWHSPKKLNIVTPQGEGAMKIIVVTRSGGTGTCDVEYRQTVCATVGLQTPVSYWPPNEHKQHQVLMSYSKRTQPKYLQSEMIEDIQDSMLGHHNLPIDFALSDDELIKYYKGRGSTALTEIDFNPTLFLLKYHFKTNYIDLLKTLENYKALMAHDKMKEPISIVKANLYTIFQCLDCLETLKTKIDDEKTNNREMSGAFAEKNLSTKLKESKDIAHQMYEEVLKRRDYADSARSALSVMQRFRFLFHLPHSIRENISRGEYSLVINDYLRARSLFGGSEIRLFQQVYKDVQEVIDKFTEMLKRQLLETPPRKCDSVKVIIRFLRQLEVDFEPSWVCLESQREWILQSIRKLSVSQFSTQLSYQSRLDRSVSSSSSAISSSASSQNSVRHPTVQLVHQLNHLLSDTFNEFWHLACYYLEIVEPPLVINSNNRNPNENGPTTASQRKAAVENAVLAIVSAYSAKMRESVLQSSLPASWLAYSLQHARSAIESLPIEELPSGSKDILINMLQELRVSAIHAVLKRASQDISSLAFKEKWSTEINDKFGAVTLLPAQYRHIMINVFSEAARIFHSRHKKENTDSIKAALKTEFPNWVSTAMISFTNCCEAILERLQQTRSAVNPTDNNFSAQESPNTDISFSGLNVSRLLLLMANNCHYCVTVINPAIIQQIHVHDLPDPSVISTEVQKSFMDLHQKLVDRYIELHLESLISQVLQGIRANGYDWKVVPQATRARSYVHSILASLSQAHSELELISPHLSRDCIVKIIVKVIEEINRVVEESNRQEWARRGHMQLAVDLGVLEVVLVALSPEKTSSDISDLSKEALSLMNIMRGAVRLMNEEASFVKRSLEKERACLKLLIQGFQGTRHSIR